MSKFPCSLTRNMTSHSKENLAFHSLLRWKMILIQILTTLCIFSLEGWENVLFKLRSERVNVATLASCRTSSQKRAEEEWLFMHRQPKLWVCLHVFVGRQLLWGLPGWVLFGRAGTVADEDENRRNCLKKWPLEAPVLIPWNCMAGILLVYLSTGVLFEFLLFGPI